MQKISTMFKFVCECEFFVSKQSKTKQKKKDCAFLKLKYSAWLVYPILIHTASLAYLTDYYAFEKGCFSFTFQNPKRRKRRKQRKQQQQQQH